MDQRTGLCSVQPRTDPRSVPADFDLGGYRLPAHPADRTSTGPRLRVRTRPIRQTAVIEVVGRLGDIVADLDVVIQLVLATGPRGVAVDLSGVLDGVEPGALGVLASSGRHVHAWKGTPVAVSSPDPRVREALKAHPLGSELIVTQSLLYALYTVLKTPAPVVKRTQLTSHPTAPRTARQFVTDALRDWQLTTVIPSACLVSSELVTNSTLYDSSGQDIDLLVAWNRQSLRLTVRDGSPVRPSRQLPRTGLHGRGLIIVDGVSIAHGVLPTVAGGKVTWAVLDAPQPDPTRNVSRRHLAMVRRSHATRFIPCHDPSNYLG